MAKLLVLCPSNGFHASCVTSYSHKVYIFVMLNVFFLLTLFPNDIYFDSGKTCRGYSLVSKWCGISIQLIFSIFQNPNRSIIRYLSFLTLT